MSDINSEYRLPAFPLTHTHIMSNSNSSSSKNSISSPIEDEEQQRFEMELEFVQCLANPWYLNHLGQQQYFKDEAFIRYLDYLQYWKKPEYARFVVYPHALHFLDLLQYPQFRDHITTSENTQEIHRIQYYHWMYLRNPPKSGADASQPHQLQGTSTPGPSSAPAPTSSLPANTTVEHS